MRFVRSPVAAGKIDKIDAPDGAMVITAADLNGVKPITPMLHKFNYKPVGQPILADGVVRFVGEPVAAVVAASEEEAEDIADQVELDIAEATPVVDARDGARSRRAANPCRSARQRHPRRPVQDAKASTPSGAARTRSSRVDARSHRQNATPMEPRAGHAAYDAVDRPRHADLHDADAASHAHRHRRRARHAGEPICA